MDKSIKYKVYGGDLKVIEITLKPQQEIKANAKNLIYKDVGVKLRKLTASKVAGFQNISLLPQVVTFLWDNNNSDIGLI